MNNSISFIEETIGDFNYMMEGPTLMQQIFPLLFIAMFLFIMGTIVYSIYSNVKQKRKNDVSPRLSVNAKVVAKRADVTYRGRRNERGYNRSATYYYVTFQVDSGDRMELFVSGNDYGYLVEGDEGILTFQGTRYLEFRRSL